MRRAPTKILSNKKHPRIHTHCIVFHTIHISKQMDEWMTCDFTSFSTVFQSYQDYERLIMKGLCNGAPITVQKILPRAGIELCPLDQ